MIQGAVISIRVLEGKIRRDCKIKVLRGEKEISGTITNLYITANELEGAGKMLCKGYSKLRKGDIIKAYIEN